MKSRYTIIFLLIVVSLQVCSQTEFRTNKLCRISKLIDLEISDSMMLRDSIYVREYKGWPIVIQIKNRRVEHIGFSFLTSEQRNEFKSPAIEFLERYFLELSIPVDSIWSPNKRMKIDKVKFQKGNPSFFKQLPNDFFTIEVKTSKGHDYIVQWVKGKNVFCKIEFPMHFNLISGQEKEESESRLFHEIERDTDKVVNTYAINPDLLVKDSLEGYYVKYGDSHYVSGLNNNQYFVMDSANNLKPYYEPLHFVETLSNLFTIPSFENKYTLDISLIKTGFKTESFQLPLSHWTKYFTSQDFVTYFGIMDVHYPYVDCLVIIRNTVMAYEHSLTIHFPLDSLYDLTGEIKAELRCYRLTSKIKSLFKEYNI